LIGTKIGSWTILDILIDEKNYTTVKAQCDCGTVKNVQLNSIKTNRVPDCGCGRKERRDKNILKKYNHLIGTKINEWTILDILKLDGENDTYAKAQCSCGEIKTIKLYRITSGTQKHCGCVNKSTLRERLANSTKQKYSYLIGTKINKWTVLEILPQHNKREKTFALCECECGTVKDVLISYLLNGKSKDCGCGRKNTLHEMYTKDLVGKRFGKLTVLEMVEERNKYGRIMWRCKCDCGNETIVLGNSLVLGHTLSCGCAVSHMNAYIESYLTNQNIVHSSEYIVFVEGHKLRFDFHLPEYNLFIEYDGEQHYYPINFGGWDETGLQENFEKTKYRDNLKNKYCEENNINLLRIPYWEKDNIETIISNHLQRLSEKGVA